MSEKFDMGLFNIFKKDIGVSARGFAKQFVNHAAGRSGAVGGFGRFPAVGGEPYTVVYGGRIDDGVIRLGITFKSETGNLRLSLLVETNKENKHGYSVGFSINGGQYLTELYASPWLYNLQITAEDFEAGFTEDPEKPEPPTLGPGNESTGMKKVIQLTSRS